MLRYLILYILISINISCLKGQRWKLKRYELSTGIGFIMPKFDVGTNFSPLETENKISLRNNINIIKNWKFSIGEGYWLSNDGRLSHSISLNNIKVTDEVSKNEVIKNRNISIKSFLIESHLNYEYYIFSPYRLIKSSAISSEQGIENNYNNFALYCSIGFGIAYFNTKGKSTNGKYYSLKELGTEGQGINGSKKYSQYTFIIPTGIGIRYTFSYSSVLELSLKGYLTFTDYIDDVSKDYFNNELIREKYGDIAADLADKRILKTGVYDRNERGNPKNNDIFYTIELKLVFPLTTSRRGIPVIFERNFRKRYRSAPARARKPRGL